MDHHLKARARRRLGLLAAIGALFVIVFCVIGLGERRSSREDGIEASSPVGAEPDLLAPEKETTALSRGARGTRMPAGAMYTNDESGAGSKRAARGSGIEEQANDTPGKHGTEATPDGLEDRAANISNAGASAFGVAGGGGAAWLRGLAGSDGGGGGVSGAYAGGKSSDGSPAGSGSASDESAVGALGNDGSLLLDGLTGDTPKDEDSTASLFPTEGGDGGDDSDTPPNHDHDGSGDDGGGGHVGDGGDGDGSGGGGGGGGTVPVPEPETLLALGVGLVLTGRTLKRGPTS